MVVWGEVVWRGLGELEFETLRLGENVVMECSPGSCYSVAMLRSSLCLGPSGGISCLHSLRCFGVTSDTFPI